MNSQDDLELHVIIGLILGGGGLYGAVVWYRSLGNDAGGGAATLGAYIAPVILGVFAGVILLWAVIALIVMVLRR